MSGHDPLQFVNDLSAKLASRSRHVCVLLGAGASKACGLPDVSELARRVQQRLDEQDADRLSHLLEGRTLEQALSRIRRLAALLEGDAELDGLTGAVAARLDQNVSQSIATEVSTDAANLDPALRFASWAGRADYHWPLEVFTINYDLVIETALERLRVPYFDGFVGNLEGRFHTEFVEGTPDEPEQWLLRSFVRLWKLHGSVNWAWDSEGGTEIVRLGHPVPVEAAAAIYPSDAKYDESRRMPFLVLQDRLRRALAQPETLTLVAGYSFGDEHLNEMIFEAAQRRPRSETIVFCYASIPEVVGTRAVQTPNLQAVTPSEAILGGTRASWEQPADGVGVDSFWGDGFALGDFATLASHLARNWPQASNEAPASTREQSNE